MIYVVQPGDTLSRIAVQLYGNKYRAIDIAHWNNITNIDYIQVDQVLNLKEAPNRLTEAQKVVNVEPTYEQLDRICDLFREGFCTYDMAKDIYKTVIQ